MRLILSGGVFVYFMTVDVFVYYTCMLVLVDLPL